MPKILTALTFVIFLSLPVSLQAEEAADAELPADFHMTAISGGVLPWLEMAKIEISASGEAVYFKADADQRSKGTFLEVTRFQIEEKGLQALYQTIQGNGFFDLKKIYDAENYIDGSFAELTILANGKKHSVHTVNFELKPFDDIVRQLNLLLPEDYKLNYDVLAGAEPSDASEP